MSAPAAPPTTSIVGTLAQVVAFCVAHPNDGLYLYTDVGNAPTGAGIAAGDLRDRLAASLLDADVMLVRTDPQNGIHFYNDTARSGNGDLRIPAGTQLSVYTKLYIVDHHRLWLVAAGTYAGKYVAYEDVTPHIPGAISAS